jgi:hypothetical protein
VSVISATLKKQSCVRNLWCSTWALSEWWLYAALDAPACAAAGRKLTLDKGLGAEFCRVLGAQKEWTGITPCPIQSKETA